MEIRNGVRAAAVACGTLVVWAMAIPDAGAVPAQEADRRWVVTGQGGAGMTFVFGDQVPDPAFGFAVGRYLTDTFEVSGQLIGFAGPARSTRWETTLDGRTAAIHELREQRRSAAALTRVNLFLGTARLRPYFAFGAGVGWGRERFENTLVSATRPDLPLRTDRRTIERMGFATLLGTGVDVALTDRWSLRPEVSMPIVWNGVESGNVTMVLGVTYTIGSTPRVKAAGGGVSGPAVSSRPRPTLPNRPSRAPADRPGGAPAGRPRSLQDPADWERVAGLPPAATLRVRLADGAAGVREDGGIGMPASGEVVGSFVAADETSMLLRVGGGADRGLWRFARGNVERVERGRLEADPPWEGILSGLVVGAGIGAIGYLGSGGGDDHEIWIPVGTALFGGPLALAGGLIDHFHRSFEVDELIYRETPGSR